MKIKKTKPQKSLHTVLMLWLLVFALVPLAFITGYSLIKYERAINQELAQRLAGNNREIQVILEEFEKEIELRNQQHASDRALIRYLTTNNFVAARELSEKWMRSNFITHHLSVFDRDGRLEVALGRDQFAGVIRQKHLEGKDVFLSESFKEQAQLQNQMAIVDFTSDGALDLIMFSRILSFNGSQVGYIEEGIRIDRGFILNLKNRMNAELVFSSQDGAKVVSSHDDLNRYRPGFFLEGRDDKKMLELNIRAQPFGFVTQPVNWGHNVFYVSLGASKQAAKNIIKNINYAFFTVVGAVVLLLIALSFIFSKIMLQPLNNLVDLVQNMDLDSPPNLLSHFSNNELGVLSESINDMVLRVHQVQKELKDNIKKLETAHAETRNTQAQLVHAAKMASLGKLVAGIAHELNNPISFIYSNMSHLKDYSSRLIELVEIAAANGPVELSAAKARLEFDYIVKDMPKLVKSCEDGARRTREIVLGLRNFSRLEESKLKEVNIHDGIESTLALLSGEIASRIKIHKNFGDLPPIMCFPSELNQVFMNVLSNAAQAITGDGEIFISSRRLNSDKIEISIRDTGVGMTPEALEKVFDPFFTTKEPGLGTGLGMSITYSIIKKHKGLITVSSKVGQGSEFKITLPIRYDS